SVCVCVCVCACVKSKWVVGIITHSHPRAYFTSLTSQCSNAGLIHQLVMKPLSTVRDIDPQNDPAFLRVLSKKNEIMIAPCPNSLLVLWLNESKSPQQCSNI
uniref:Uncharacterized protein n=1 Tax=Oncorhynchus kisutch TaxID=8019 RepID=A0A8C7D4I6_ONCKI